LDGKTINSLVLRRGFESIRIKGASGGKAAVFEHGVLSGMDAEKKDSNYRIRSRKMSRACGLLVLGPDALILLRVAKEF